MNRSAFGVTPFITPCFDSLESRQLFAVTVVGAVPDQAVRPNTDNSVFALSSIFKTDNLDDVSGTVVSFPVEYGLGTGRIKTAINMVLFQSTPLTAQNFLTYITSNKYDNSIVHFSGSGMIRSGSFTAQPTATPVPPNAAIANEFTFSPKDDGKVNVRGTVGMYKPDGAPNGAKNEWYINLTDNSETLDKTNGGYTTFAKLFSGSLAVADAIAALPTTNIDSLALPKVPVSGNISGGVNVENLVKFSDPQVVADPTKFFTYTISSSDSRIVTATQDSSGNLVLDYGTKTGTATVTVTATDLTGASVTDTITVNLDNPKLDVTVGTNTTITDGQTSAVNLGTAFKGQTATRTIFLKNSGNDAISFTGLTLPDGVTAVGTLPTAIDGGETYELVLQFDTTTERTISGNVTFTTDAPNITDGSFTFPVSLTVGSAVSVGTGGYKTVKYVDPDGTTVIYSLKGQGAASLGFAGTNLAVTPDAKGQNAVVTGDGGAVTLSMITLAGTNGTSALSVKVSGGDSIATLGTLNSTDNSSLKQAALSRVSLIGAISVPAGIADLSLLSIAAGTVDVGSAAPSAAVKSLKFGTIANSNLTIAGAIKSLAATSFADSTITLNGTVSKFAVNSISNSAVKVNGTLVSAAVKGAVTGSSIDATGAVTKASFGTFSTSRLSSGLTDPTTVPDAATDFSGNSVITSLTIAGKGNDAFSGSSVFAASMGKIALGTLTSVGAASQVVAASSIASLSGKNGDLKAFKVSAVTPASTIDSDLAALGVPTSRLDVTLVS